MGYLSASTHAAVIADPIGFVPKLYQGVRSIFLGDLPVGFSALPEPMLKLAFAATLACDLKPYGACNTVNFAGMLATPTLSCDAYCVLAGEFNRILNPDVGIEPAMVGWNRGAVGNHAQMLIESFEGTSMFCDPTIGALAIGVSLDGLCMGYRAAPENYKSFFPYNADTRADIAPLEPIVMSALLEGKYRASDLLYWMPTIDAYRSNKGSAYWATPQSWNI